MISLINKITVDLIHDHDNIVFFADFSSLAQFFFCPYAGHRIVWTAEQEQFYLFFCNLLFHIFVIHMVFSIFQHQWIID